MKLEPIIQSEVSQKEKHQYSCDETEPRKLHTPLTIYFNFNKGLLKFQCLIEEISLCSLAFIVLQREGCEGDSSQTT